MIMCLIQLIRTRVYIYIYIYIYIASVIQLLEDAFESCICYIKDVICSLTMVLQQYQKDSENIFLLGKAKSLQTNPFPHELPTPVIYCNFM